MPVFLKALSVVGTAAMIWVGGGIIIHGLEEYGLPAVGHAIHAAAEAVAHAVPAVRGRGRMGRHGGGLGDVRAGPRRRC